ncbi:MAG: CHASE4 domain-containing protein [Candidatus Bathyarchaeia archaeon]
MNLRRKTMLAMTITPIIIIVIMLAGAKLILLDSFTTMEMQVAESNVKRGLSALANMLSELDSTVRDWAAWDDTYIFIQDANEKYKESNLVDETFANLEVNMMIFINSQGQIVYSKAFNLTNSSEIPVPQDFLNLLSTNGLLWNHTDPENGITGIVHLQEMPLLIASHPIVTSQRDGPIRGALIIGRFLDSRAVEELAESVLLPLSITSFNNSENRIDFQSLHSSSFFEDVPIYTIPISNDYMGGYAVIKDAYGNFVLTMRVDTPRDFYKQALNSLFFFVIFVAISIIIIVIIATLLIERGVLTRIERLVVGVKKMGSSRNLSESLSWDSGDEISLLADAIDNTMNERNKAIRELAAMVGHDLRNPLTGISSAAQYLKKKYGSLMDEKGQEMLEVIEKDVQYSNKIINDLLEYSTAIRLDLRETTPKSLVTEALSHVAIPKNIQLIDSTQETLKINVDVDKMKRVFINLIKNAIDAMPKGGQLAINSENVNGNVKFVFADTGMGISEKHLKRIFEPLFTTKARGMGLGLSICKRIVEAHGGTISVESVQNKGTTFTITLPIEPKLE